MSKKLESKLPVGQPRLVSDLTRHQKYALEKASKIEGWFDSYHRDFFLVHRPEYTAEILVKKGKLETRRDISRGYPRIEFKYIADEIAQTRAQKKSQ